MKNEEGVVKQHALTSYEDALGLAVRHGKMTEERREELLARISKVVSNDARASVGTETDIRVSRSSESGKILIDMVAHFMRPDGTKPTCMNVSYAAANCAIQNATSQLLQ